MYMYILYISSSLSLVGPTPFALKLPQNKMAALWQRSVALRRNATHCGHKRKWTWKQKSGRYLSIFLVAFESFVCLFVSAICHGRVNECPNGGTCSSPNNCINCNAGYYSPKCDRAWLFCSPGFLYKLLICCSQTFITSFELLISLLQVWIWIQLGTLNDINSWQNKLNSSDERHFCCASWFGAIHKRCIALLFSMDKKRNEGSSPFQR